MAKAPKTALPDPSGFRPQPGDQVVAHYLAGDKPHVHQAAAKVVGIRDDGTLDLACTLMNRPVTIEAAGPMPDTPGKYATGWSRPAKSAPAAKEASETSGAPAGSANVNPTPGPLKPIV